VSARTTLRPREIALPLLSAATVWVAMTSWTSFTTGAWHALRPLAAIGLAIALIGVAARQLRLPGVLVFLIQAALGWAIVSQGLFHSVVPVRGASRELLLTAMNHAYDAVVRGRTPIPVVDGINPYLMLGGAVAFLLADAVGCTLHRVAMAGFVPLIVLALTLSMSADSHSGGVRWWIFVLVVGGYLGQLVVHEWDRTQRWGRAVEADDRRATRTKTRSRGLAINGVAGAAAIGAAATALSLAAPTVVPVAHLDLDGFSDGNGGHRITVTNPLVDLHRDLTQGADVPLLTVTSYGQVPTYFRIAALTQFDDTQWTAGDRHIPKEQSASGAALPQPGVPSNVQRHEVNYTVTVDPRFDSRWLPTPSPAHTVKADGDWRYDVTTMDFLAAAPNLTTAGLTYTTSAEELDFKPADLQSDIDPGRLTDSKYTVLPSSIPQSIYQLASEVVTKAGATTPFAKAVALQRWFRSSGGFTYDTHVSLGTGVDDLQRFLDPVNGRRGYCQQFAAAMAVMARMLDIPSRVAVGFLNPEKTGPNTYVFSTHDMHAWPELYFSGTGWVRFEPTPAARAPQVPSYTVGDISSPTDPGTDPSTAPGDVQDETPSKGAHPEQSEDDTETATDAAPASHGGLVWVAALVVVVLVAVLLALPSQIRRRRRARRLEGSAEDAWAELHDTIVDLGLPWPDSRSPRETASRVADYVRDPGARDALVRLTQAVEEERYAAATQRAGMATDVLTVSAELNQHVSRGTSRTARLFPRTALRP
jgi:transglutaminase-like putative cysteine protease